jgi:hypothetical protein
MEQNVMSGTTGRGYPYPQSTDDVDPPTDIQALADAVNDDVDDVAAGLAAVAVRLTQGTAQVAGNTSGSYFTLTFGTEDFDLGGLALHDIVTNTSRIVIGKKLGLWLVGGTFAAVSNAAATNIRARITLNGSAVNGNLVSDPAPAGTGGPLAMYSVVQPILATVSTDYVELQGLMTAATGSIGSQVNGEARSAFWATFMGTA